LLLVDFLAKYTTPAMALIIRMTKRKKPTILPMTMPAMSPSLKPEEPVLG